MTALAYVESSRDRAKEAAVSSLQRLVREAHNALKAIEEGGAPLTMAGGGMGITRVAADAEREVGTWLALAQAVTAINHEWPTA